MPAKSVVRAATAAPAGSVSVGAPCSDWISTCPGGRPTATRRRSNLVEQLVRELAHEMALPVVPLLAVGLNNF